MSCARPRRAAKPTPAAPSGAPAHERTISCAMSTRRTNRGCSGTVPTGSRSARSAVTRHRPRAESRANQTWTTERLWAQFFGWTKCTPLITVSRISRCECPTTTRSGFGVRVARTAASFSGPTPVVSYEEVPPSPLCTRTTLKSTPAWSSRRSAAGAASAMRRTCARPATLARSQIMTPGVVNPVTPMRTPARWITANGANSSESPPARVTFAEI